MSSNEETAHRYAQQLGISEVKAGCRGLLDRENPKLSYIRALQSKGKKVMMIGDGPNDAPALAACDLPVALKTGQDIGHKVTQEQASAVIENNHLPSVLAVVDVSKQTLNNIKQNLWLSLGYNMITLLIASGGLLALGFAVNPAIGAGLMILQSCFILLNAYRFKNQWLEYKKQLANQPKDFKSSHEGSLNKLSSTQSLSSEASLQEEAVYPDSCQVTLKSSSAYEDEAESSMESPLAFSP